MGVREGKTVKTRESGAAGPHRKSTGSRARKTVHVTDVTLRATFLRRMRHWAKEVAETAPEQVLADALANPTMRGGLVDLLSRVTIGAETSPVTKLREEALARGLAVKEELRELAGGFVSGAWVSGHLGISRQAVDKRRNAGKLLAFQAVDGSFEYPLCQFSDEGVVPGLEEALGAFGVEDPWERLSALVTPAPALSGRSVIEVLRTARSPDERNRALAVVRHYLQ